MVCCQSWFASAVKRAFAHRTRRDFDRVHNVASIVVRSVAAASRISWTGMLYNRHKAS